MIRLLIILLKLLAANAYTFNATICTPSNEVRSFILNTNFDCKLHKFVTTKQCVVNVYDTNLHSIRIPAHSCSRKIVPYTSYEYFTGITISHDQETYYKSISQEHCNKLITELIDDELGELKKN